MILFFIIAIMLIGFLIIGSPYMFYLECLQKKDAKKSAELAQKLISKVMRLMIWITGTKVDVKGLENIPKDGGVLFVSNHRGVFDIHTGFGYTPKLFGFVAKKEIQSYLLLSNWMTLANCLFLDRKNVKNGMKTILEGIEKLKQGTSVWICPEGTRSKAEDILELKEFHEGSFKMAEKAGVPVVPVAITGTAEMFERQLPAIKKSHIVLEFGKPIYIDELDKQTQKRIGAYTRGLIIEMLQTHTNLPERV